MAVVSTKPLLKKLTSFGRLPKLYTTTIVYGRWNGKVERKKVNLTPIQFTDGDRSITVAYEAVRRIVSTLPEQTLTLSIGDDGLRVSHQHGEALLKHLGEWEDTAVINLYEAGR